MTAWTVGQAALVVDGPRGDRLRDVVVEKIGRKWLTVKAGYSEWRFDKGGQSNQNYGLRPRLYVSREVYAQEVELRDTWRQFTQAVRGMNHPPKHLTAGDIRACLATVTGVALASQSIGEALATELIPLQPDSEGEGG